MRSVLVLGAAGRSPRGEMPAVVPRSLCAMGFAIVVGAWLLGCASAASASASASAGSASGRVAQCEPGDPGARLDRRCEVGDKPPPGIALGASSSGSGQTTQGGAGAARREPFKAPPPGPLPGGGYLQLGAPADRRAVATVQRRLGRVGFAVRRDGIYGPQTASAVRRFQIARRLLVDAIVGRQTAAALRYYARTPAPPAQARPPRAGVGATAQRRTRILRAVAATKNRVTFDTRALDADRIVSATLRSGPSKWPITGPRLRRAARSGHVDITIIRRAGKRAAVVAAARAPKAARRPTRAILRRSKLHVIIATPPRRPTPPDDPDANADPGRAPSPADPGQAAPPAAPAQAPPLAGKTLVFEDNFDGAAVNTGNWSMYNGPGHGGNGLRRRSAFSVANGLLTITASWDGQNITSGGMEHKENYTYGSFEVRVRTQPDPTAQTSGVVLTWPQSGRHPYDGENDWYETGTRASRHPFWSFIHHYRATSTSDQTYIRHDADAADWQIMRMDWEPDAIRVYRNGTYAGALTNKAQIPDVPHHAAIQLDAFSNRPLAATVQMQIDYIRIYR